MRLTPSNPDVDTLVRRIDAGDIDLQPDFQRGEVWSVPQKQRLIDSILRNWHVPPIHVILRSGGDRQEVLDGQQRLMAIHDFFHDRISIDGTIEPQLPELQALHALTYSQLPWEWRRQFGRFAISVIQIDDYAPDEPSELFFRLNQNVRLTAAEQRNAFYGPAREQIRHLSELLERIGLRHLIGFTNARMAYDDVLARTMFLLERGTLTERPTATALAERYRMKKPFPRWAEESVAGALALFDFATFPLRREAKLNKAAFFSWLWFTIEAFSDTSLPANKFTDFFDYFNAEREALKTGSWISHLRVNNARLEGAYAASLVQIFNDRATARVSDVASVLARDVVIWIFFVAHLSEHSEFAFQHRKLQRIDQLFRDGSVPRDPNTLILELADAEWGRLAVMDGVA